MINKIISDAGMSLAVISGLLAGITSLYSVWLPGFRKRKLSRLELRVLVMLMWLFSGILILGIGVYVIVRGINFTDNPLTFMLSLGGCFTLALIISAIQATIMSTHLTSKSLVEKK